MEIRTINRVYDDNGKECCEGDTVLIQTKTMDEITQATIDKIMTSIVTLIIDDKTMGYMPIRVRTQDVKSITLYQKK